MSTRPDDHHLDDAERWARERLEQLEPQLGSLRVTDLKGGPPGMHDFEGTGHEGTAVLEVTSVVEPGRQAVMAEISQRGKSLPLPDSASQWLLYLRNDARIRELTRRRDDVRQLLSEFEGRGVRSALGCKDHPDEALAQLWRLGIAAAHYGRTRTEGRALLCTDAYAGFAWRGEHIDHWLEDFLVSGQGANKLQKLARADASERHLVVVYDTFTPLGIGIPLGLSSRHDEGAADYVMPSIAPPEPLTDLWLLPFVASEEVLRWNRASGWTILSGEPRVGQLVALDRPTP